MQHFTRKAAARIGAVILILVLALSATSALAAASFSKSHAGIKYGGQTFKIGSATTPKKLKKAFGSYKRYMDDGCTCGYATYLYKFSKKNLTIETLQKKKGGSEKIITITCTDKSVPTVDGLKVGNKMSAFGRKLGTKVQQSGSTYRYVNGKYYLYLKTKNKTVTQIRFILDL